MTTLLAVPNVSEGRDQAVIDRIAAAFEARLLDVHTDLDHNRSVFTLAGPPGELAPAVLAGARVAVSALDIHSHEGVHPRVGVLDVAPTVYLEPAYRGAAAAEALLLGDLVGEELQIPVLLYGELAAGRTRAELRQGGPNALARRIGTGEVVPDFGPRRPHRTAGVTLVGTRPPLLAFNLELGAPATLETARTVAAAIREGASGGLPGVRALGLWLDGRGVAQVSMNIEDYVRVPLATVIELVRRHVEVSAAELVGLAPAAALEGFPDAVPLRGRATIEDALRRGAMTH